MKPTQLRKDLGYFGQFGTRGLGYNVELLADAIAKVLGTASPHPVVIVGVGNLGSALIRYSGFQREGFEIIAAFDLCPEMVEEKAPACSIPILHANKLEEYVSNHEVKMAILSVPGESAQQVTDKIVGAGVQAILNFSPLVLQVPDDVLVRNVDLALELEHLNYFIS